MFFFLKKTVYEGFLLNDLANIRDVLSAAGIRYEIRVINQGRTFSGSGSGQILYDVRVKMSDFEQAQALLGTSTRTQPF